MQQGEVLHDEYGSWDFEDADLDALLENYSNQGQSKTQSQTHTQGQGQSSKSPPNQSHEVGDAAMATAGAGGAGAAGAKTNAVAAKAAWGLIAEHVKGHVLPHLRHVWSKEWTVARYAQESNTSSQRQGQHNNPRQAPNATQAKNVVKPMYSSSAPYPSASGGGLCPSNDVHRVPVKSLVDAGIVLELEASAALAVLCSGLDLGERGVQGTGAGNGDDVGRGSHAHPPALGGRSREDWRELRKQFLDMQSQPPDPAVPEQRLLPTAFFSIVLTRAYWAEKAFSVGTENTGVTNAGSETGVVSVPVSCACVGHNLLVGVLRGVEWELLRLWMQSVLDPMAFPLAHAWDSRDRRGGSERLRVPGMGVRQPSDVVREGFEGFTECLALAYGVDVDEGIGNGDRSGGRGRGGDEKEGPLVASALRGVLERRSTMFEAEEFDDFSNQERKVLERVLDVQSVMLHMAKLWEVAKSLGSSHPKDSTALKNRVVNIVQTAITALKRFLPEVFPTHGQGGVARGSRPDEQSGPGRYSFSFRSLYGRAAFAVVGMLARLCGEALKGPPIRDLVGTCFEGVAFLTGNTLAPVGGGKGGNDGSVHPEVLALAVMHVPDLLLCFAQMSFTLPPVKDWLASISKLAIKGGRTKELKHTVGTIESTSDRLLQALASGLRGRGQYPADPAPRNRRPSVFAAIAAVVLDMPPPLALSLSRPLTNLRIQYLTGVDGVGIARELLEAMRVVGSANGTASHRSQSGVGSFSSSKRLLKLVKLTLGPRFPWETPGLSPPDLRRDVLPLLHPLYSLIREALVGEPGPARALGVPALSAAVSVIAPHVDGLRSEPVSVDRVVGSSGAGAGTGFERGEVVRLVCPNNGSKYSMTALDDGIKSALPPLCGVRVDERRAVSCFAEAVTLAVAMHIDIILSSVSMNQSKTDVDKGSTLFPFDEAMPGGGIGLVALGQKEDELEALLRQISVWSLPNCTGRGWGVNPSVTRDIGGVESEVILLPELLQEADTLALTFGGLVKEVAEELEPRLQKCKFKLSSS
ncbi:unnamed protein product [Choristocarpus tenellus]